MSVERNLLFIDRAILLITDFKYHNIYMVFFYQLHDITMTVFSCILLPNQYLVECL